MAIAHDYLTQRGGAERVALAMARAFPGAPVHTSVYEPAGTFPEFAGLEVRTTPLQHVGPLRRDPRRALPLLAPAVGRHRVDAEVTICQTTGWAHGMATTGQKVVYAHNTPRWLYQREEYLAKLPRWYGAALAPLAPLLRRWDREAARSADVVLAGSTVARERIRRHWGRDAEVLYPPPGLSAEGEQRPTQDLTPGYWLTVARLLPYKRVDRVIEAVTGAPGERLVVVGDGPDRARLDALVAAHPGVTVRFVAHADDAELRWLYAHAAGLVTAAREDFGLTALEAMGFGTPVVAVDEGGFRETVVDGETGLLVEPTPAALRDGLCRARRLDWDRDALRARAERFSEAAFVDRLRAVVDALS